MTARENRIVNWLFGLLAIVAGWQLDLPVQLAALAHVLGAQPKSWMERVIIGAGVPAVLALLAASAIAVYDKIIWPLIPNASGRGWWVYALLARTETELIEIVGYFFLEHSPSQIRIVEAAAFYAGPQLSFRGTWTSDYVWFAGRDLRLLFFMNADRPAREPMPSKYEGYLELHRSSLKPLVGSTVWSGFFHDLGDRRLVTGPVYAERISRIGNAQKAKAILGSSASRLLAAAHSHL